MSDASRWSRFLRFGGMGASVLAIVLLAALPAGATSPTKAEIREARKEQIACIIAAFFGRPCRRTP